MKLGSLIKDPRWPSDPPGLIVGYDVHDHENPYKVLCAIDGKIRKFNKYYVEMECEVLCEYQS